MSLKNIILKSLAVTVASSIIFGNISVCGIGISRVIAESTDVPNINLEIQNEKYVQYSEETNKGVAIQSKLSINSNQTSENYLPTTKVGLEVKLPSFNGCLPERAIVAEARTKATTGEELNTSINQNYDSNSGLLKVSYGNTANDEGEIYTGNKDAKDEFEIIYIYPEQAYTGNEAEVKLEYAINAKMTFETENSSITSQNSKNMELTEKENKENIETFNITKLEKNIYKGFLYSNVENKTNYDTEYKTVSTLSVLNSQISKDITMELKESEFILNDEEETQVSSNGKIEYKATGISKYEFDRMLGQEGVLEIYNGETLLATIKYIEVNENNKIVKKLAVVYSEEDIKILSNEETTAIVEYKENITNLKIKTSKPITEGFIHFENQNVIKASEDYETKVEKIKYLSTESTINEKSKIVRMELLEPETKISVISSNNNFSTLQTSKTTITIKLDDTNASTKLFDNPIITVKLPEGLTGGKITNKNIVNGNGLKIKSTSAKENIITIELEGKQTSYDLTNVSGGANVVIDIEDIDFSDTTPTHTDKIEVECTQGTNAKKTSCNVNIVSKAGLLMIATLTGYSDNKETTTTIDSTLKKIKIDKDETEKTLVKSIDIVNNYEETIENLNILGKIQYSDTNVTSTFASNLKGIEIEGAKVYYSEKEDASYEDESWKEEYLSTAKSYKIAIDRIEKQSTLNLKIKLELPANLGYNASEYLKDEIRYTLNSNILTTSALIGLETEKIENKLKVLSAQTAQLNIDTHVESGAGILENKGVVYEKQTLKYVTTVQNITNNTIENIVLKGTVPDGTTYVKMKKDAYVSGGYFDEYVHTKEVITEPISLKPGETYTLQYELRVNEIKTETAKIKQNLFIYINGEEKYNNILENVVYKAEVQLDMKYSIPDEDSLHGGETAEISLSIKNLTSKNITGKLDLLFNHPNLIGNIEYDTYIISGEGTESIKRKMPLDEVILNSNETITFMFYADIKDVEDANFVATDFRVSAKFSVNNIEYTSNVISKELLQTKVFLITNLEGYINNQKIENNSKIENNTNITYKLTIENIGMVDAKRIDIMDTLPDGLIAQGIKYTKYIETEEGYKIEEKEENLEETNSISLTEFIPSKKILTIYITCYLNKEVDSINNIIEVQPTDKDNAIKTNELVYFIEKSEENIEEDDPTKEIENIGDSDEINEEDINDIGPTQPETPTEPSDPSETENSEEINNPTDKPEGSEEEQKPTDKPENKFTISGLAWLDTNKNGQRDADEKLMDSVIVTLINKETGNYVTDDSGNKITSTTNSNGEYKFENIKEGKYLVLFEFDTNTYTVTTYQKDGVEQKVNSDAIITTVSINGNNKTAGITDQILLNENINNIDIGLIENAKFDLSLDKQITKITVINSQGTQEFNYKDGHTAKVDLVAKYMNKADVIVTYKFTIKNLGEVAGYVNTLVDNLPSGLEFSSELNKDWYKGSDGQLYTTSLSGIAIKPGETSETELVLTKKMTEENTGTFVNNAVLEKISNLENIQEKENAIENNKSSAVLVISIKTGSVILYTGITLGCILILVTGAYIIKKKVLDKEI